MSDQWRRVASVDFGATEVKIEILEYSLTGGTPVVISVASTVFATSKPNDPRKDYPILRRKLRTLHSKYGFIGIVVGIAARLRGDGAVAKGGNLNWAGLNLGDMLSQDFQGIRNIVANDGVMFAAYELIFGALSGQEYHGKSVLVVVPGTGIGTCLIIWTGDRYLIVPGEGQHNVFDRSRASTGCNCGSYCFESESSGIAYERQGIDPSQLNEHTDVAIMAPGLGALVASFIRPMPALFSVVVIAGRIAHKRPSLTDAIRRGAVRDLRGFIEDDEVPPFLLGSDAAGGTQGCLARWILETESAL